MEFVSKNKFYYGSVLLIIVYALFLCPVIGYADNGDFGRVMPYGAIGLPDGLSWDDLYYNYALKTYAAEPPRNINPKYAMPTTTGAIVFIARVIYEIIHKYNGQPFDIRLMGVVYGALFFLAVTYFLKLMELLELRKKYKAAVFALFVFIFMDTGYIAYFNSLYSEATIFVFALLTLLKLALMYFSPSGVSWADIIAFSLTFLMFTAAKLQTIFYLPLLLLFFAALFAKCGNSFKSKRVLAAVLSLLFLISGAVCVLFSRNTLPNARNANIFNSVFVGVLKNEDRPKEILRELGLDEGLSVYQNMDYYQAALVTDIYSDALKREFFDRITMLDVSAYYLRHPDRLYRKVNEACGISGNNIPEITGNLEKHAGGAPEHATFMVLWNTVRQKLLPKSFRTVILLVLIISAAAAVNIIRKRRAGFAELLPAFCIFGILTQPPVKVIGDGLRNGESAKHMFLYNLSWDILIFSAAAAAVVLIARRRKNFPKTGTCPTRA